MTIPPGDADLIARQSSSAAPAAELRKPIFFGLETRFRFQGNSRYRRIARMSLNVVERHFRGDRSEQSPVNTQLQTPGKPKRVAPLAAPRQIRASRFQLQGFVRERPLRAAVSSSEITKWLANSA